METRFRFMCDGEGEPTTKVTTFRITKFSNTEKGSYSSREEVDLIGRDGNGDEYHVLSINPVEGLILYGGVRNVVPVDKHGKLKHNNPF